MPHYADDHEMLTSIIKHSLVLFWYPHNVRLSFSSQNYCPCFKFSAQILPRFLCCIMLCCWYLILYIAFNQRFGANFKNLLFLKFAVNFLLFSSFFSFLPLKPLKIHILTSFWGTQHLNAGQNIQQFNRVSIFSDWDNCNWNKIFERFEVV